MAPSAGRRYRAARIAWRRTSAARRPVTGRACPDGRPGGGGVRSATLGTIKRRSTVAAAVSLSPAVAVVRTRPDGALAARPERSSRGGQRDTRWRVVASVSVVDRPTPAKDCLPGSVAGGRRVLGSRRDRPAGESWAPSPPTDRQAVNVGAITRHFGIRLPRLQGPLQRPTTGSLTHRADSASWRTSHPRKSSPAISTSIVLRHKARSSWAVRRAIPAA
jgi:hypothetical protein